MSELVATRPERSPLLDGIRRAEAMALVPLALAMVISFGASGAPLSFALLAAAAVLLPRRREVVAVSREQQRLQVATQLLAEGNALRARYDEVRAGTDPRVTATALVEARLEIVSWIADTRARLDRYPEFAGIYEAHFGADLISELDGRLQRLSQIVRLAQASRRLNLPI